MAYDTQELFKKAIKIIPEKKLYFIEDVYTYLGIASSTFYEHFPSKSSQYKEISELLSQNAIETKNKMRNKWYKSENATLQLALMKIIGSDEDRKRLTKTHQDITTDGEKIQSVQVQVVNSKDATQTKSNKRI